MGFTPLALTLALVTGAPKRPLFDAAPAPLAEEREPLRGTLELVSSAGAAMPDTLAMGSPGEAPAGSEFALLGLYRPSPYFACGGVVRFNGWRLAGGGGNDEREVFGGAVGRLYFRESGVTEPYLELDLGVSDHRDTVWAARNALGVDWWLGAHTRLGPSFAYTRYAERGYLSKGLVSLSVSLTLGAGDAL
jgi:hypothetical protein